MNETLPIDASHPASPGRISVALIEDNRLVREGIAVLLNRLPDLTVVAAGSSGDISVLRDAAPQVVLLDFGLRNGDSLRVAQRVKSDLPETRIVVMDLLPVQEDIIDFVNLGVSGFIMKDATLDELARTIRSVMRGENVLPRELTGSLFSQIAKEAVSRARPRALDSVRMTPREREVVNLIAEGMSNKEIADDLHIAIHTVKSHVRNIMEKLMLHTRLQIAAYAHKDEAS